MLVLKITYEDESTEIISVPDCRTIQNLRDYFKSPRGRPALFVEILEYLREI